MKFIHDWNINKLNKYLFPSSFVVQILIFPLECHLIIMDDEIVIVGGKIQEILSWNECKINNYLKNPIVIYDSTLFEFFLLRCLQMYFNLYKKIIITNDIT
jgi:hypothetical protein